MNKQGQITIFIILAILIVATILLLIIFGGTKQLLTPQKITPEQFIKRCIEDSVSKNTALLGRNGGVQRPNHYINYSGEQHTYLCYQADNYKPCNNYYPALEESFEKELQQATINHVKNCFIIVKEEYESQGFNVNGKFNSYEVDLVPGSVKITVLADITINNEETGNSYDNFNTRIQTNMYEHIKISQDIVNSEAEFCYYDSSGYMLLYPEYDIKRISYYDSRIYHITNRNSKEILQFATKSCNAPGGI